MRRLCVQGWWWLSLRDTLSRQLAGARSGWSEAYWDGTFVGHFTALDAAGGEHIDALDGVSLLPLLKG